MKFTVSHSLMFGLIFAPLALTACGDDKDDDSGNARIYALEVGAGAALNLKSTGKNETAGDDVQSTEVKQCADSFGVATEGFKIAGSENAVELTPTEAFAAKITGNKNSLTLTIKAKEGETAPVTFPGICLVLGGNQPSVNITVTDVSVSMLRVIAHGNGATLNVKLEGTATLPESESTELNKHLTMTVTKPE